MFTRIFENFDQVTSTEHSSEKNHFCLIESTFLTLVRLQHDLKSILKHVSNEQTNLETRAAEDF